MGSTSNIDLQKCRDFNTATDLHLMADSHIKSFNYFLGPGLEAICQNLTPMEVFSDHMKKHIRGASDKLIPFDSIKLWFEDVRVGLPTKNF